MGGNGGKPKWATFPRCNLCCDMVQPAIHVAVFFIIIIFLSWDGVRGLIN